MKRITLLAIVMVCAVSFSFGQTITNGITLKVIDKTKGAVTSNFARPDNSVYTWLGNKTDWQAISNSGLTFAAGNAQWAGFYSGLPGGKLEKTANEWIWSYTFSATNGLVYAWNPGIFTDLVHTEHSMLAPFNLNGGQNLEFAVSANGLATGVMTVTIESASVATINNAETQQAATVVVTSLGRQAATAKIDVYPNPAVDVVNVTCDADVKSVSVKNLLGIALKTTSEMSVDLSDLSNGIYVVEVETVTGAVGVEKIVVKK